MAFPRPTGFEPGDPDHAAEHNSINEHLNLLHAEFRGDNAPAASSSWTGAVAVAESWLPSTRRVTLTGNTTLTLPSPPSTVSGVITLVVKQDATGGRTLKAVGARTAYGVAPALTGTANSTDIVHLLWDGAAWTFLMGAAQISVPSGWVS